MLLGVALLDENQPVERRQSPVVAFCLDLSQQKHLEDELRKHADELAEADARKNEFLAMLGTSCATPWLRSATPSDHRAAKFPRPKSLRAGE